MTQFKNELAKFVYMRTYSRYIAEENRRETWPETVKRVVDYYRKISEGKLAEKNFKDIYNAILNFEVMPSMRLMWSAGTALDRNSFAGYNCAFTNCDDLSVFGETLLVLMLGAGEGFSVEQKYIDQLPIVEEANGKSKNFVIGDSKEGWSEGLDSVVRALWAGYDVTWDVSKVRPLGAKIKTFGGTASGPKVLVELFEKISKMITKHRGRRLSALNVHDIMCKIAEITCSAGVRRCLPEGSQVHTEKGLVAIENIEVGTRVLTSDGYHEVTNIFDQGVQEVAEVFTQDSSFKCTANHRLAVLTGQDEYDWKMAQDLEEGDRLIAPSFGIGGSKQEMPSFKYVRPPHSTTSKDIIIPELDEDMAWLLGLIHGDGCVSSTANGTRGNVSIPVINTQPELGERAKKQLERFGVNVGKHSFDNYYTLRATSNQLGLYLQSWLKKPNTLLEVPKIIQDSCKEIKLAFVSGLMDADGSVKTRPVQVVCTVYEQYAKDIRMLLSSCGVQTRVKALCTSSLKEGWQPKFSVTLINGKAKDIFRKIPTLLKSDIAHTSKEQYTNSYPHCMNSYSGKLNESWSRTDNKLIPVTVNSVEYSSEEVPTWDIEVDTKHEFFCEGYLMHNSALISISDLHHEGMRGAKKGQFWIEHPERAMSNNSACFRHKPSSTVFMNEWLALAESGSGERGIFNLSNIRNIVPKRRDASKIAGSNPCCFSQNVQILTNKGEFNPEQLQSPFIALVGGKEYKASGFVSMGMKPVHRLVLCNGYHLDLTLDHEVSTDSGMVKVEDLTEDHLVNCENLVGEPLTGSLKSIKYIGKLEVWDCNVDEVHRLVANGIVASNCEIFLRSKQVCNLTEAIIRKEDTMDTLLEKIKLATIMGTIQSTLTNFGDFVTPEWKKNCEEERLLGVSMTGQMDNPKLLTPTNLQELRDYAIGVNTRVARKLGINRSASITTTKPSGTVSQLVDSSSGFHARFAPYYLRRVRISGSDPLFHMMISQGVKFEPEVGQTIENASTWVCQFPVESPKGAITVSDLTAIEQLVQWLKIKENYTEHTVSATIYVEENEWFNVGNWVYEHFDRISGLSFLPKSDHVYQLAPYEEITKDEFKQYEKEEVIIDYSKLPDFEKEDLGEGSRAAACDGAKCEITQK